MHGRACAPPPILLRREGWSVPSAQVLLLLREVSQRLRLPAEHVTHCLELCAVLSATPEPQVAALAAACAAHGLQLPPAEPLGAAAVHALLTGVHDAARLPGIIKNSRRVVHL